MPKYKLFLMYALCVVACATANAQTITVGRVTGMIKTCQGTASAGADLQHFTVNGTALRGDITATAPANFEIGVTPTGPFSSMVQFGQTSGVAGGTIYVRASATAQPRSFTGLVTLSSPAAITKAAMVSGVAYVVPAASPVNDIEVEHGATVPDINIHTSHNYAIWESNNTAIGIPAKGERKISSFIASNFGTAPAVATIKARAITDGFLYGTGAGSVQVVDMVNNDAGSPVNGTGITNKPAIVNNAGSKLYVLNATTITPVEVNAFTAPVLKTPAIFGPIRALDMVISPDDTRIYVLGETGPNIAVIDGITDVWQGNLTGLGGNALAAEISNDGNYLYVSASNGELHVINTDTRVIEARIPGIGLSDKIIKNTDGSRLYLLDNAGGRVVVVNTVSKRITATIPVGAYMKKAVLSPSGDLLYVLNKGQDRITTIDTRTNLFLTNFESGINILDMVITPDGKYMYTFSLNTRTFARLDLSANVVSNIMVPANADLNKATLAMSPDGSKAYLSAPGLFMVANTADNALLKNTNASIGSISDRSIVRPIPCQIPVTTFTITVKPRATPLPNGINANGSIPSLSTTYGTPSAAHSFMLACKGLTDKLWLRIPTGFEASTDNVLFIQNVLEIPAAVAANPIPIYVRLAATADAGNYIGEKISVRSTGQADVEVPIGNSVVDKAVIDLPAVYVKTYGQQQTDFPTIVYWSHTQIYPVGFKNTDKFVQFDCQFLGGRDGTAPVGLYPQGLDIKRITYMRNENNYVVDYRKIDILIKPAPITIRVNEQKKKFGDTRTVHLTSGDFTVDGMKNGETIGAVTLTFSDGGAADAAVGRYNGTVKASDPRGGTFNITNYDVTYVLGNLEVIPAFNASTPAAVNTTYGTASASSRFDVLSDNISLGILVTAPAGFELSTDNVNFSNTITVTGTVSSPAYIRLKATTNAGIHNGDLVLSSVGGQRVTVAMPDCKVDKAPLTLQAVAQNKVYGDVLTNVSTSTTFNIGIGPGLKNGNRIDNVSIAYGAGAAANSDAGIYPGSITITAGTGSGGFLADNYAISYVPADMQVLRADLRITIDNAEKTYGETLDIKSGHTGFSAPGLKNGESVGSITVHYVRGGAPGDAVGVYVASLTGSLATGGNFKPDNYNIGYIAGTLTVKPATLTIKADDKTRPYKTDNPVFTFTYSGFVNGENESILTTLPTISSTATQTSQPGKYPITISGGVAPNYTIVRENGQLVITPVAGAGFTVANTFTPNGDGANDTWLIPGLVDHPACSVKVFNRNGQSVYTSIGYATPWDGTHSGSNLASGVYYYVIDLRDGTKPFSGSISVIR